MDVEIDVDRMKKGKAIEQAYRKGVRGGIPWYVILEPGGAQLATADGPEGNVGCPVQPAEVAYFLDTLRRTRRHLSEADLDGIAAALETYAQRFRRR